MFAWSLLAVDVVGECKNECHPEIYLCRIQKEQVQQDSEGTGEVLEAGHEVTDGCNQGGVMLLLYLVMARVSNVGVGAADKCI